MCAVPQFPDHQSIIVTFTQKIISLDLKTVIKHKSGKSAKWHTNAYKVKKEDEQFKVAFNFLMGT